MASTDAKPVPQKNVAYRHYFAIRKNDGTLITTWSGADSEVSKDGGTYADCTNEATEIGSSGTGYIDLTSTEMNADAVVLKVTVTNTDALPYVVTLFPEEAGDIRTNMTQIASSDVNTSSAQLGVNVVNAAGTAWGSGAITAGSIATGAITSAKFASGAITSTVIASSAIGASQIASNAIATAKIADGALTAAKFGAGAITSTVLADGALAATKFASSQTFSTTGSVGSVTGAINTAAGTITTLDGLDTAQDLQHATTQIAVGNLNNPSAGDVAVAVWDEATSSHTDAGSFGKAVSDTLVDTNELQTDWADGGRLDELLDGKSTLTAAQVWAAANAIEGTYTPAQSLNLILAACVGKISGAATTTLTIRDATDSRDAVVATVDGDGNRSAVTLDAD